MVWGGDLAMSSEQETAPPAALTGDLEADLAALAAVLKPCGDLLLRRIPPGPQGGKPAALLYLKYQVDAKLLGQLVLKPLLLRPAQALDHLQRIPILRTSWSRQRDQVVDEILRGRAALLTEGSSEALLLQVTKQSERPIGTPQAEAAVRGPQEAFNESLETNLGLLRRRLVTPSLRMEFHRLGRRTRTETALLWLEGIADQSVVDEVRTRVSRIQIDGVLDSGYVEELIEDAPYSPFPQIEHTERPDKLIAALLGGRVGVIVDGSPFALIAPVSFFTFLQASEDYYERYFLATSVRWIRALALFLALLAPSFYVAIASIHQEMIPIGLVLRLAATREGAPFPLFLEALLMEVAFEILREAGIRLPRSVGQAVSIVGGLVIGEAAVRAGIASPVTIVVVALTGIASFSLPSYGLGISLRVLRFPMLLVSAVMGLPGVTIALLMMITHLASLRSFGAPYLAPLAPSRFSEWKDLLVRVPWWAMGQRPRTGQTNAQRLGPKQRPQPPPR